MSGPPHDPDFVDRRTTETTLRDGTRVLLRPIVPEDKERLVEGLDRLSPESRYRRFMAPVAKLTRQQLVYLTELDHRNHFAWVAFALDDPGTPGIGVSRYVRLRDEPEVAEAALAVLDDYQGRGLGSLLLRALAAVAVENGIGCFRGEMLSDNRPARELMLSLGGRVERGESGGVRVTVDLPQAMEQLRGTPAYDVLRAVARGEAPGFRMPPLA